MGAVTSLAFLGHATAQVSRLKSKGEGIALAIFKSNVWTGALVVIGLTLSAMLPEPAHHTLFSEPEIVPHGKPEKVSLPFGLELKTGAPRPAPPETWLASDIRRALERDGYVFPDATETQAGP
jgi:4-hydroxybenzoate polyprenyltransferase